MRVKILSGDQAGQIVEQSQSEAEANIASGFAAPVPPPFEADNSGAIVPAETPKAETETGETIEGEDDEDEDEDEDEHEPAPAGTSTARKPATSSSKAKNKRR